MDAVCDGKRRSSAASWSTSRRPASIPATPPACCRPTPCPRTSRTEIKRPDRALAAELDVIGLMNIQFAVKDEPGLRPGGQPAGLPHRAFCQQGHRRAAGQAGHQGDVGKTLEELGFTKEVEPPYFCVKESVFPFSRFPGVDTLLGPEMSSTGEVMGIDDDFGMAFAKSQMAAGQILPLTGGVLFSVKGPDKAATVPLARDFQEEGYKLYATGGTAAYLRENGLAVTRVPKIREGRPNIIDLIKSQEIHLLINTPEGRYTPADSYSIRRATLEYNIPYTTTLAAARATLDSIRAMKRGKLEVKSLQEYHEMVRGKR